MSLKDTLENDELGATDTEGGIMRIGITHEDGDVVLGFETAVSYIAMPPDDARSIAYGILRQADEAEQEAEGVPH